MKKEYTFNSLQSGKVIVVLDNNKITIRRKGALSFLSHGLKGDKTIMLNQISSIQLKYAKATVGYLQFVVIGSQESKGGLQSALRDENTIVFGGGFNDLKMNKDALEIKEYIENYNTPKETTNNNTVDKYDKLKKIKELLDNNIINQEEFDIEKEKILNEN